MSSHKSQHVLPQVLPQQNTTWIFLTHESTPHETARNFHFMGLKVSKAQTYPDISLLVYGSVTVSYFSSAMLTAMFPAIIMNQPLKL